MSLVGEIVLSLVGLLVFGGLMFVGCQLRQLVQVQRDFVGKQRV